MSRVFQKQTSGIEDDKCGVDSQDICLEEKGEVKQFSSQDI